jgi:hypothetical protein
MEEFPPLPSKKYQDLRHEIRSGDILLCSGSSAFSTLIQKATNSVWSHVAFILRLDAIDRIMVLESVETMGVRTVPLSSYAKNYNGSGSAYPGRLMIARHQGVREETIVKLSRSAVDLLGYPYGNTEIVHIATRISLHALGVHSGPDNKPGRAFICSEYAQTCFHSIGINIECNHMGFIAPADFATHPAIQPLCYVETGFEHRAVEGLRHTGFAEKLREVG